MLTLKLWSALSERPHHAHPAALLQRTALPPTSTLTNLLAMGMSVILFLNFLRFPLLIFPIAHHLFCLKLTLQIAELIASIMRQDKRDLLAVTAIGEFALLFDICRLCRDNRGNKAARDRDLRIGRGIMRFMGFTFVLLIVGIVAKAGDLYWGITTLCVLIGGTAVLLYLEYRQSLVLGMLIAMHAGISGERFNARLITLVAYAGTQLAMFAILLFIPSLAYHFRWTAAILSADSAFVAAFGLVGALFYGAREVLIIGLWNWLQQRINDDVPVFESN